MAGEVGLAEAIKHDAGQQLCLLVRDKVRHGYGSNLQLGVICCVSSCLCDAVGPLVLCNPLLAIGLS